MRISHDGVISIGINIRFRCEPNRQVSEVRAKPGQALQVGVPQTGAPSLLWARACIWVTPLRVDL